MALLISTRWHLLATIMREEQSDHWLTFQLWIMGIYLHASVHLPPVCLSCLNQRLGSATSALSPSYKGMAPHKRLTTGDIYSKVLGCHCKRCTLINTSPQHGLGGRAKSVWNSWNSLKQQWLYAHVHLLMFFFFIYSMYAYKWNTTPLVLI